MNQEQLDQLLARYVEGNCTDEEILQVEAMVEAYDNKQLQWENLNDAQRKTWLNNLHADIQESMTSYQARVFQLRNKFKMRRFAAAAAIIVIASTVVWLYRSDTPKPKESSYANDVAPGKNAATITLANGKTINLSDAKNGVIIDASKLTYNDGTVIDAHDGQQASAPQTISTPAGGTYQVRLPDGTRVWLNAASSLKYPASFAAFKERKVELRGEAYFEVNKDKTHPFIVKTNRQEVQVLGTHFNVNAYASEKGDYTTLLEGSVKVNHSAKSYLLKEGEQAAVTAATVKIAQVNTDEVVDWKNGNFNFQDKDITSIMTTLERWYNIEVVYEGEVTNIGFNAELSRNNTLVHVLKVLEKTGSVKFKVEGRRVTVM
uniref:FecR family protein n=1 Tax=Pedobacter schmidteae TaxID=2201271 RepID=UPI000EAFB10F|nr:FecR family protein [Pedobacter schmidteae]